MKKIGELNTKEKTFVIYYDPKGYNHYRVYEKFWESGKGWRKHLIEKYADLYSCVCFFENYVYHHNEEER